MSRDEALAKIKAAGWSVAAELGQRVAIELLERVAREISQGADKNR